MKRTLPLAAAFVLFFSAFIIDSKAASFPDLRATSPFYEEMMFLKNERIISGSSDSTFRPDEPVMRGQFSDFLARALDDRFKVEKPSYAMDQTKVYRYSANEVGIIVYSFSDTEPNGWNVWETYEGSVKAETPMAEHEDSAELFNI
ncbi:S-layer homology domain-containing protein [Domibacillus tundrae]|uniref:S-layer homology domain-containing protein n=1 Tax=Domibacillus tundrae TaxID=1587527 RepID=UPI000617CF9E|nr:S-layer homology domain-containing protein [Domibacillus tundrae]